MKVAVTLALSLAAIMSVQGKFPVVNSPVATAPNTPTMTDYIRTIQTVRL